jgi:DNA-directed RNA polymerase subunit RPC12/RpoP
MKIRFVIAWSGLLLILARFLTWSSGVMGGPVEYLMERAILPCPKCGGEGEDYFETGMESMRVIRCDECGHWGEQAWDDLPKAISLWNVAR